VALLLGSDELIRRWTHRIAGVIMLAGGLYHVFYAFLTVEGRQLVRDMWPKWQDVKDVRLALRHYAGRSTAHPRFGRFGYVEKAEYWAVVWGTLIMGVTGLAIWFKIGVTQFLPRWAVDVATTIHYYEAILACLAIVVWHFYHVLISPDVYPMNWAWLDGKVSEEWHREHHPLDEKARQMAVAVKEEGAPPAPDPGKAAPA
jgi:cytochrome b subunit of formate dehydrogenase